MAGLDRGTVTRIRRHITTRTPSQLNRIRDGIEQLSNVSSEDLRSLVGRFIEMSEDPSIPEDRASIPGSLLTDSQVRLGMSVAAFLAPPIVSGEPTDLLLKILKEELELNPDEERAVSGMITDILQVADRFSRQAEVSRIADATLPSLTSVDFSVDVRLDFESESSSPTAVPVAIFFIDTDASDQQLWVQLSKRRLWLLKRTVDQAVEQFGRAEAFAKERHATE